MLSGSQISQARLLEWLPFPSPGDLPYPEIKPRSSALQADSLPSEQPRDVSTLHFRLKEPKKLFKRPPEAD